MEDDGMGESGERRCSTLYDMDKRENTFMCGYVLIYTDETCDVKKQDDVAAFVLYR